MPTTEEYYRLLTAAQREQVTDEDGDRLHVTLNPAATATDIEDLHTTCQVPVHRELSALLGASNGLSLWGLDITSTQEGTGEVPERSWIAFHSWGNGDFDWIVVGEDQDYDDGNIVFYCHENGRHARVATTLLAWLEGVMNEVRNTGGLAHPWDFLHMDSDTPHSMYRGVFEHIQD